MIGTPNFNYFLCYNKLKDLFHLDLSHEDLSIIYASLESEFTQNNKNEEIKSADVDKPRNFAKSVTVE